MATRIKKLPRKPNGDFGREFMANGRKYTIRTQEEGIGILRYNKLLNMSSVWAFQADFSSQIKAWRRAVEAVDRALNGKGSYGDFYAIAQAAVDGVNRSGQTNYLYAYWVCCLFVVRDGEDMTKFIEAEQQEKINDWAAEGFHEDDFDELVKKKLIEFSRNRQKPREEQPKGTGPGEMS